MDGAESQTNGARLKATYLEGADGSRQFLGWYDTQEEMDCSFSLAADGSWRCLPSGADTGKFFADSACTRGLAAVSKGCAAPAYAISSNFSACVGQSSKQVFLLGPRYTGPLVYWIGGGVCSPMTSEGLAFQDLYTVGDEVPAASFLGASPQREP